MTPEPSPSERIGTLPTWEIGIEETRGAPRPWIFNAEAARRHRLEHPSLVRRLIGRIAISRRLG